MTAYENLKRKENILREASRRAESPDMKELWLAKAKELKKKISEMTVEEAEKVQPGSIINDLTDGRQMEPIY